MRIAMEEAKIKELLGSGVAANIDLAYVLIESQNVDKKACSGIQQLQKQTHIPCKSKGKTFASKPVAIKNLEIILCKGFVQIYARKFKPTH